MATISETGYAQNVANLKTLTSAVTTDGIAYNPAKESIKVVNLKLVTTNAENVLSEENAAKSALARAISDRKSVFESFDGLVTRAISFLKSCGAPKSILDTAAAIVRDIRGVRTTAVKEGAKSISASQKGFDDRLYNFDRFIKLLVGVPEYSPNEADLKVVALTATHAGMKAKNEAVIIAETALKDIRIKRNEVFNAPSTGLVDVALDVKMYIKAVYGATSPQYKSVSKLQFTRGK
jgi:hypothetical protein